MSRNYSKTTVKTDKRQSTITTAQTGSTFSLSLNIFQLSFLLSFLQKFLYALMLPFKAAPFSL